MTSKKLTPHRRRQLTIERLVKGAVDNKSRQFWKIQMKMLNELEEKYSLEFLEVLTLDFQVDQIASLSIKTLKHKLTESGVILTLKLTYRNIQYTIYQKNVEKITNPYIINRKIQKIYLNE